MTATVVGSGPMPDRLVAGVDVAELVRTRDDHRAVAPPSATRTLSVADAYAVQDRVREILVGRGERIVGWKAGFTSKTAQAMFQATEPVCAFLLANGVFASGAEVPLRSYCQELWIE